MGPTSKEGSFESACHCDCADNRMHPVLVFDFFFLLNDLLSPRTSVYFICSKKHAFVCKMLYIPNMGVLKMFVLKFLTKFS